MGFNAQDPFDVSSQLDAAELALRDRARNFARDTLVPMLAQGAAGRPVIAAIGQAGLLGLQLPIRAGGSDVRATAFGLVCRELDRIDSGFRTAAMVQDALVVHTLHDFGSPAQTARWLPGLITGDLVGAFGLTEPDAGSDLAGLATRAEPTDGGYRLTGRKAWITNASIADLLIVWARSAAHDGQLRGFVIERGMAGLETPPIDGRQSLQATDVADVTLDAVFVPQDNLLAGASGSKAAFQSLNRARFGTAWGVLGAAGDCLERAIEHGLKRRQFGRPLAATQLYQRKLADMTTDLGLATQATMRLGRLIETDGPQTELGSLVKRNNCRIALRTARTARDMLGAEGLLPRSAVMRHAQNLESVSTYEGSDDVLALVLGRAITGLAAF